MFAGNSQARTYPCSSECGILVKTPALSPVLFEECHALFNVHLDEQEKSRLAKCSVCHLKGVISSSCC